MSIVNISRKDLNRFRLVDEPGTFPAIVTKLYTTGRPSSSGKSTVYDLTLELKGGVNDGIIVMGNVNTGMLSNLLEFAAACANETVEEFYPADIEEDLQVNLDACMGKEFGATIGRNVYNNQMRNSFDGSIPLKLMEVPFG